MKWKDRFFIIFSMEVLKLVYFVIRIKYFVVLVFDDDKGYDSFSGMDEFVEVGYMFVDVV